MRGVIVTHIPEEAKTALTASNHRFHGPKVSDISAFVPEIQPPTDGKVRFTAGTDEVRAASTKVRVAAAELLAERDTASILSKKGDLVEANGIFSEQECAAARAWKPD